MQLILQTPGVAASGCIDWTMTGTSMMGSGTTGQTTCPWGHGVGMTGPGKAGGWELPNEIPGAVSEAHARATAQHARADDYNRRRDRPAKRDALLRQHYDTVYRNMQTMRRNGLDVGPERCELLP